MYCLQKSVPRGQTSHLVFRWRTIPYPSLRLWGYQLEYVTKQRCPMAAPFQQPLGRRGKASTGSAVLLLQARCEDNTYTPAWALLTCTGMEEPQPIFTYSVLKCIAVRQFTGVDCLESNAFQLEGDFNLYKPAYLKKCTKIFKYHRNIHKLHKSESTILMKKQVEII